MLSRQIRIQKKTRLMSPKLEAFAGQAGMRWSRVGEFMASPLATIVN